MDVGRDLTVASLQDKYDSKNHSWNAGADVTVGYGVMINGNVGFGQGKTNSKWVGQQTSIVGKKETDIYVENNTHIKGAIIATEPGGDLTLDTNTLTFEKIKDKNKGYDWGFGISGGFSLGGEGLGAGKEGSTFKPYNYQGGSETPYLPDNISGHYAAHDKQGILRPTVTEGEIIVRSNPDAATDGSLDGLNRDIHKAREITKDKQVYTDVYISPGAIEEVFTGFKGIRTDLAKIDSLYQSLLADIPKDLGEKGKAIYRELIESGVDAAVAEKILNDPQTRTLLAANNDVETQLAGKSLEEIFLEKDKGLS